jgi:hypothetical protein
MLGESEIAANLNRVRERVSAAARRAGRRPEEIVLVGVAKGVAADRLRHALEAGLTDVGENYVQEAQSKRLEVGEGARWHFVGHLQTNKAKPALGLFDLIQTVDSIRLAHALARAAQAEGRRAQVLLQVNTSGEATKSGFAPEQLLPAVEEIAAQPGLRLLGLMSIGRWEADPEAARGEFRLLARLGAQLGGRGLAGVEMRYLSMGMSHDLEVAIEEGANLIRVGTAIFGPRPARQPGPPARRPLSSTCLIT